MVVHEVHLVIIEDDADDFFLIQTLLKEAKNTKFHIEWVNDSSMAVEAIKRQNADAYILDYRLGESTGLEILEAVGVHNLIKPVILLSGQGDYDIDLAAMEKGASDYLSKSQLSSELIERSIRYSIKSAENQEKIKSAEKDKAAKITAEAATQVKTQFLANMSHEIRTPLSAILGYTDLALDETTTLKEKNQFLSIIKKNGEHLLELINDILDLTKVEGGHIQVERYSFNWRTLFDEVIDTMAPFAAKKSIILKYKIDERLPKYLKSDSHRFKQILINLIHNAIKFTEKGTVIVECNLKIMDHLNNGELHISVQDTGIGISPDDQKKLFKPFMQAHADSTRKFGGTGLGLDLSRKLANLLGGSLTLSNSTPGKGSTFLFTLPSQFSLEDSPIKSQAQGTKAQPVGAPAKKVLLVEDSIDNQFLIGRMLKKAGYEYEVADNGHIALEKAFDRCFDAILMDIQMPGMNGFEATELLRQKGYEKPIIAITAHALNEEKEAALRSGFTDYVTKPVQAALLVSALDKIDNLPEAYF